MNMKPLNDARETDNVDDVAFSVDAASVRQLAMILNETDLSEIEYECAAGRIRVLRHAPPPAMIQAPVYAPPSVSHMVEPSAPAVAAASVDWEHHPGVVTAPLVGTVYLAPQPDAPPFVNEGDAVTEGQTLLIIEAMKVMNPIRASRSGVLKKRLVDNGMPVEFGQPLLVIA